MKSFISCSNLLSSKHNFFASLWLPFGWWRCFVNQYLENSFDSKLLMTSSNSKSIFRFRLNFRNCVTNAICESLDQWFCIRLEYSFLSTIKTNTWVLSANCRKKGHRSLLNTCLNILNGKPCDTNCIDKCFTLIILAFSHSDLFFNLIKALFSELPSS
jgi:hypothetical protein